MTSTVHQVPSGSPKHPTEATFRSLLRACGLLGRVMQPYFARFGISGSQWGILITLQRAEEEGNRGLRLTDLGGRLLIRPPSVTGVVDRLQRLGLVVRGPAADDLRAKQVSLTPAGRELVGRVLEGHSAQINAAMNSLSHAEQKELHRLLERMGSHLEAMLQGHENDPTD